jgi:putative phosphoesterase
MITDVNRSPFVVGVVSDTHIPDRSANLHSDLIPSLKKHQVKLILHAGDISIPRVIKELETVAPVVAVRGNRDVLFSKTLPIIREIEIEGVSVALTHGHFNFLTYWIDKLQHLFLGYKSSRYLNRLEIAIPNAKVIVFGHSHSPEILWREGKLFFNPGSTSFGLSPHFHRTWGSLVFFADGRIEPEIFLLD